MRKLIIIISCGIVLLLLGYTGYRTFQVWKQSRLMAMAKQYLAKADMHNTVLSLQQLLKANPRNLEASRMMAGLTEAARSPSALSWRQRVLELNPKSFEDRLALVQTAITFQDYALATNTLAGVAEADKKTAVYHNLAGTAALVTGQPEQAEAHFSEAIRLDPANPVPQVNLATVRLHSSNALDMAEARIDLKRVILNSTNAFLCSQSRRELIVDAMRFNDSTTALTLSQELAQQTNANFPDKLLRLDVLKKIQSPEFKPTLASYQSEAATSPVKLYDLANWQISRLSPAEALGWLQTLPMQTRTNQPAALLAAQCQIAMRDWKGAQDFLQNQNWAELEFERHALLARCLRERNLEQSAKTEWQLALNGAAGKKMALNALFRLAAQWRWASETEQILWTIVNTYPEEQAAVQSLRQTLFAAGSTRPLMQLISLELRRNPSSLELKNDLAMVALLLNAQELKPHDLAREAYQKDPQNGSVASTYAFSLYSQGKPAEALKVMSSLNSRSLETPEIGSYYGLILKANGHLTEAKSYLKLSSKAHLLPEEKALFDQAKAGL
jgi:cytochrome c-type biogenesis protein CcmH/NrfG